MKEKSVLGISSLLTLINVSLYLGNTFAIQLYTEACILVVKLTNGHCRKSGKGFTKQEKIKARHIPITVSLDVLCLSFCDYSQPGFRKAILGELTLVFCPCFPWECHWL